MKDDVSDIIAMYDNSVTEEHLRLEEHQLEYDLTWRYLDKYLPAGGRVLEIGAATGRYTLALARRGYAVTAVDLSGKLLAQCQEFLDKEGLAERVRLIRADARDLGAIEGNNYDAVLLMGPLYHLVIKADRRAAIVQARDRLKAGGLLFSAFISRYGIFGDLIKNVPDWIHEREDVRSILDRGRDPEGYEGRFRGYFATVAEIAPLHEGVGFETLALAGVEPGISADDESYNQLQGEQRQLWLDLFFEISTEPSSIAASRHLLYIGKKR